MPTVKASKPGSSDANFRKADKPTGAKVSDDGSAVNVPTTDLPGTDHPNPPATDQQGVKGMDNPAETGTPSESEPHQGSSYR